MQNGSIQACLFGGARRPQGDQEPDREQGLLAGRDPRLLSDRLEDPADRLEVENHLAGCAACASRVHQERAFHDAIRAKAKEAGGRAPPSLRLKIQAGLEQEHRSAVTSRWIRVSAVAAAICAMTSAAYVAYRPVSRQRFIEDAAARHAKRFPLEVQRVAPHQLEAWFGDKLEHLPTDRREALIMRFALGMDNREIARALGRTDGATKVLIHRAIKQLQEEMDSDG